MSIQEQLVSITARNLDSFNGGVVHDGSIMVGIPIVERDITLLTSSLKTLRSQMTDVQANNTKIVVGINGWRANNGFLNKILDQDYSYRVWKQNRPKDFKLSKESRGNQSNPKIEFVEQQEDSPKNGKIGMLIDMGEFVASKAVSLWGGQPNTLVMTDAEGSFSPDLYTLAEYWKLKGPNTIVSPWVNHIAYNGDIPLMGAPFSAVHELIQLRHLSSDHISGSGYIGETSMIFSMLNAIYELLPSIRGDDVAMTFLARLLNITVDVPENLRVANRTFPVWDSDSWRSQIDRWNQSGREVVRALDLPFETRKSGLSLRLKQSLSVAHMMGKAILYQIEDSRSIPGAIRCLSSLSINKNQRSKNIAIADCDITLIANSSHASW